MNPPPEEENEKNKKKVASPEGRHSLTFLKWAQKNPYNQQCEKEACDIGQPQCKQI
jgi:hypothetical protein